MLFLNLLMLIFKTIVGFFADIAAGSIVDFFMGLLEGDRIM